MFEHAGLSFGDAMDLVPDHIGIWLNALMAMSLLSLVFIKKREAQVVLIAFLLSIPFSMFIYSKVGLSSRVLGVGHVLFWLPAAVYVIYRIWRGRLFQKRGIYQHAFVFWLSCVSAMYLVSNYWDVPDALAYVTNACWSEDDQSSSCHNINLARRVDARMLTQTVPSSSRHDAQKKRGG